MRKIPLSSFLSGFTSILDIFQPVKLMGLSQRGFVEDRENLCRDSNKIQQDVAIKCNI